MPTGATAHKGYFGEVGIACEGKNVAATTPNLGELSARK